MHLINVVAFSLSPQSTRRLAASPPLPLPYPIAGLSSDRFRLALKSEIEDEDEARETLTTAAVRRLARNEVNKVAVMLMMTFYTVMHFTYSRIAAVLSIAQNRI
jgi:hypothetical protein